jgi:shikimate kinase
VAGAYFIIGFMGSGKSTFAKKLSALTGWPAIDLDEELEKQQAMSIASLFSANGESGFRKMEAVLLRSLDVKEKIISCGGGTPCFENNLEWMKQQGIVIFLDTDEAVLLERLMPEREKRPLIAGFSKQQLKTFISEKKRERMKYYSQAHLILHEKEMSEEKFLQLCTEIVNSTPGTRPPFPLPDRP